MHMPEPMRDIVIQTTRGEEGNRKEEGHEGDKNKTKALNFQIEGDFYQSVDRVTQCYNRTLDTMLRF